MTYDVLSPTEYIDLLEYDWRRDTLEEIRQIIMREGPKLKEGINYKMLSYGDERGFLFHLNAQKQYVSLYVGDTNKIDPDGTLLQGLDCGKGCIRFKKTVSVSETGIQDFVRKTVDMWNRGEDLDC